MPDNPLMPNNLTVATDAVRDAAADLTHIGTALEQGVGPAMAKVATTVQPGLDEVSAAITGLLNGHGAVFADLTAQAQMLQQWFVSTLTRATDNYAATEQLAVQNMESVVRRPDEVHLDAEIITAYGAQNLADGRNAATLPDILATADGHLALDTDNPQFLSEDSASWSQIALGQVERITPQSVIDYLTNT